METGNGQGFMVLWLRMQCCRAHCCGSTYVCLPVLHAQAFLRMMDSRKQELMSDVFDLLLTLGCVPRCSSGCQHSAASLALGLRVAFRAARA